MRKMRKCSITLSRRRKNRKNTSGNDNLVDAISIKYDIFEGEKHPFYHLHGSFGYVLLQDIIGIKEGEIKKEDVIFFLFLIIIYYRNNKIKK